MESGLGTDTTVPLPGLNDRFHHAAVSGVDGREGPFVAEGLQWLVEAPGNVRSPLDLVGLQSARPD